MLAKLQWCFNCIGMLSDFRPIMIFFQLAFGAAILNIQIPLMLGDLVNIVARYMREHTGNYMREMRGPALKLLGLYGLQVSCLSKKSLSMI